jgi:ATP-dependent DNA helicase RecG
MQSALMAPTEILAGQHYATLQKMLEPLGISVGLLTGSMRTKEKNAVRAAIADGTCMVLVGTHAIFQKTVAFANLALVITDEQHRFGVEQRSQLAEKGNCPHKLVMSATPIPRTLALMIYGDLDISILKELPSGRKPVETYAVTGRLRQRAYHFIEKELVQGRQAYIVCPMIEEGEQDLQAVAKYAEQIQNGAFAAYRVGLLHGKMKAAEKETVMRAFRDRELDLLVCTTVVEVGVDVPNATVMMIENAERFGLSQLHQLRGRVGRGSAQSYCILVTDHVTEACRKRMQIMSRTRDGFQIAEADLQLRGPGDFFGERQHGLPPLKAADMVRDMELVQQTEQAAKQILEDDPDLTAQGHQGLRLEVLRLFSKTGENGVVL